MSSVLIAGLVGLVGVFLASASPCATVTSALPILFVEEDKRIRLLGASGDELRTIVRAGAGSYVVSPSWSPDGRKILFISLSADGRRHLNLVNPSGAGRRLLADEIPEVTHPSWSPDGKKIAFIGGSNRRAVFVVNVDGSGLTQLSQSQTVAAHPVWSPDGTKLVFESGARFVNTDLYVMNADGTGLRPLTQERFVQTLPRWSNGRKILYVSTTFARPRHYDLMLMDADGTDVRRLLRVYAYSLDDPPSWSPTGQQILFTSKHGGNYDIYLIGVEGGRPRKLTTHPARDVFAVWSPDGNEIAFVSNRSRYRTGVANTDLYVADAETGKRIRKLTQSRATEMMLSWRPVS